MSVQLYYRINLLQMFDVEHWKHMLKNVKNITFIFNGDRTLIAVGYSLILLNDLCAFVLKPDVVHLEIWFTPNVFPLALEHVKILHYQQVNAKHRILHAHQDVFVQTKQSTIVFKMNVFQSKNVLVNTIIFDIIRVIM